MIINEKVEVKWNGKNIKWYEDKGYIFTRKDDKFFVSPEDLPETSGHKIKVKCDVCGDEKYIQKRSYIKSIQDGIYTCRRCKIEINNKIEVKTCKVCSEKKPLDEFHKRKGGLGGVRNVCKKCRIGLGHDRYINDKEYILERFHNYYKNNKEIYLMARQRRRAREKSVKHDFTSAQWRECQDYFRDLDNNLHCVYCDKVIEKATQDHFIALMKGGEYTVDNIVPCCLSCNSSKQDKDFFDWYTTQEFYSKEREDKIIEYLKIGGEY